MSDDVVRLTNTLRLNGLITLRSGVHLQTTDDLAHELEERVEILENTVANLITFNNHYEFPTTGDSTRLYVAIDEDVVYRWTGDGYEALTGIDALQRQIAAINGGNSSNEY